MFVHPPRASTSRVARRQARGVLGRLWLLVPLCALTLVFALSADADSNPQFPTITVTAAGPDRPWNFNSSFYLQGDADDDADRVQAIVVRKGSRVFGGSQGPSCRKVRTDLQPLFDDVISPGVHTREEIFAEANLHRSLRNRALLDPEPADSDGVLVTDAWMRPPAPADDGGAAGDGGTSKGGITANITANINITSDSTTATISAPDGGASDGGATDAGSQDGGAASGGSSSSSSGTATAHGPGASAAKPAQFKLFVPAAHRFFLPGSTFCLLIFQHKAKQQAISIADPMMKRAIAERSCDQLTNPNAANQAEERGKCRLSAMQSFNDAIRKLVQDHQQSADSPSYKKALAAASDVDATRICAGGIVDRTEATRVADEAWKSIPHPQVNPAAPAVEDKKDAIATAAGKAIENACKALDRSCKPCACRKCELPTEPLEAFKSAVAMKAEEEEGVRVADDKYPLFLGPANGHIESVQRVGDILGAWKKPGPAAITDPYKLDWGALRGALPMIVARRDELNPQVVQQLKDVVFTDRTSVSVTRKDAPGAAAAKPAAGNPAASNPAATQPILTADLPVPNSAVSVRDLIELVFGRIRLDGTDYLEAEQVVARLDQAMKSTTAFAPQDVTNLQLVRERLRALHDVVMHTLSASEEVGSVTTLPTERQIERALGNFLVPVLVSCSAGKIVDGNGCGTDDALWPGYVNQSSPLSLLADALDGVAADHDKLLANGAGDDSQITLEFPFSIPVGPPIGQDREFSQQAWVSSYLTPVVGAMIALPGGSTPIIEPYVGVQLHFTPNPVEDPLWSHGFYGDVSRAFALEVALATTAGPFGSDGRFRGPGAFAPVLLGGSVHLIPYTSITGGLVWLNERRSTLPQENYQAVAAGFVAVNVQANLPDIIRALVKDGTVSITASGGGK